MSQWENEDSTSKPTFDHFAELPPLYGTTADELPYGTPLEAAAHEPVEGEWHITVVRKRRRR